MASSAIDVPVTRPRGRVAAFFASTVGKKMVMAVSGVVLVLFVIGHMIGNLQLYVGPEALNRDLHATTRVDSNLPSRMLI